jgi:pimeloyl-ACP methyl ester carboxylesterase
MAIYTISGQEIHTTEEGARNRQKAILIHGWSSSAYAMSPLSALLSQRFSCISVDLPGYGKSPSLQEKTTIPAYAELMVDLIDHNRPAVQHDQPAHLPHQHDRALWPGAAAGLQR